LKFVSRIEQVWPPHWRKLERLLDRAGVNYSILYWLRMLFNYPLRLDKTFDGVLFDSIERHFLLRAQLWAHGFPLVSQNRRNWGLKGEKLTETVLAQALWDTGVQTYSGLPSFSAHPPV
jgi:hypothetical protein